MSPRPDEARTSVALRYAIRSDRGLVRGNNEDSVYAGPRLLAIADGMGGHAGGEVASRIVITHLQRLDEDRPVGDLITVLRDAVGEANQALATTAAADSQLEGMGTTLTALRLSGAKLGLVHVGDSRGYLLRDGELSQITHDDTYVQSLVDVGRLTPDEAFHHPRKSVILRALSGAEVDPDVAVREAILGDRYLLCSDGLTDVVRAETLQEALSHGDPQECADTLVQLALRGGGPDNVTCIVADVVDADDGDDVPVVAGAVVDAGDESADTDSPAARAAGRTETVATAAEPDSRRRRVLRWVVPAAIVVVLAVVAVSTWLWTQTQYFVGHAGAQVAVFKGVNTSIGPLHFYSVVNRSGTALSDLTPAARSQVRAGITARNRSDAFAIVGRLQDNEILPLCSTLTSSPTSPRPTTSPSTRAPISSSRVSGTPTGRTTARRTTTSRPTTRTATTRTATTRVVTPPPTPPSGSGSVPTRSESSGSASSGSESSGQNGGPVPNVDCRVR